MMGSTGFDFGQAPQRLPPAHGRTSRCERIALQFDVHPRARGALEDEAELEPGSMARKVDKGKHGQ